ncbi:unnamed protein product [Prorocentrum cordatum]|uniref:Uncharacterized protein n=1 Tax=Prorocentrum cordatum TaxID=2364126 RepID=A0ABN9PUF0_9DINO|nr:unnamed protein product [Polarella glacialis]
MRINAMEHKQAWYQMIGMNTIIKHGSQNPVIDQDQLVGEKVMAVLKKSTYPLSVAAVKDWFGDAGEADLEHDLSEFVAALGLAATFSEIDAISERVEFTVHASSVFASHKAKGTWSAEALFGHPYGKKLAADLDLDSKKAKKTEEVSSDLERMSSSMSEALGKCDPNIVVYDDAVLNSVLSCFGALTELLDSSADTCLTEFLPSTDLLRFDDVVNACFVALHSFLKKLQDIADEMTMEALLKWAAEIDFPALRIVRFHRGLEANKCVNKNCVSWEQCEWLHEVVTALTRVCLQVKKGYDDPALCTELASTLDFAFSNAPPAGLEAIQTVLRRSPVFADDGEIMRSLGGKADEEVGSAIAPILARFREFFPEPNVVCDITAKQEVFATASFNEDMQKAMRELQSVDPQVRMQLSTMSQSVSLAKSVGCMEKAMRALSSSSSVRLSSETLKETAAAVKDLRSWSATCATTIGMDGAKTCFEQGGRFKFLENVIDMQTFPKSLVDAADESLNASAAAVGKLIDGHVGAMNFIPTEWANHKENLFDKEDMCMQLITVPRDSFKNIGCLCQEARAGYKVSKGVHNDGCKSEWIPIAKIKDLARAADMGVQVVRFAFAVWHVCRGVPNLKGNKESIEASVESVRKKFTMHKVEVPSAIHKILKELAGGEKEADHFKLEIPEAAGAGGKVKAEEAHKPAKVAKTAVGFGAQMAEGAKERAEGEGAKEQGAEKQAAGVEAAGGAKRRPEQGEDAGGAKESLAKRLKARRETLAAA